MIANARLGGGRPTSEWPACPHGKSRCPTRDAANTSSTSMSRGTHGMLSKLSVTDARQRSRTAWNTLVTASYLGYVGKFFSTESAPLKLLTMYSLVLNAAWRLHIVRGKHIVAASSTIGSGMLLAYWCSIAVAGPEVVYGSNRTRSFDNYDAFDDFMLHFFFPFEAIAD